MTELPEALRRWQERARARADTYSYDQTKRAVEQTEMSAAEAEAAGEVFEAVRPTVRQIARHALRRAHGRRRPSMELEDVVQASYELFLRALVGYDPEKASLRTYLLHALRRRLQVRLQARSTDRVSPEETSPARPARSAAPAAGLPALVGEVVEAGRLPGDLKALWRELRSEPTTSPNG
jgi:hypothetical protein